MSYYSATRGLLATDLVILNHGEDGNSVCELAPPSPRFYITPRGRRLSIDRFNGHHPPTRWVFSGTRLELMTRRPRVRYYDR
ncbi:hypothetical protein TNCV_2540391 [Trichonephila clavipes]|nr:hypothetical protein TNCV_2540391 [Trichonephila clavipes]